MKTAKLIIGIVSIVLFGIIMFQSCAAGVGNALADNTTDTSGSGGVFVAILMLIGGIVGVATRTSKGGGITSGIFFILAAIIGFSTMGTFADLVIWSVLAAVFGVVFLVGIITMKKENK